jgi:uncharacterized protein (DUF4415 family)
MKKSKPEGISLKDWEAVDSPPLDDVTLAGMKPVSASHPGRPAQVRGPQKAPRKTPVFVRLDSAIVEAFRATGRGWQTRMNAALKEWLAEHRAA